MSLFAKNVIELALAMAAIATLGSGLLIAIAVGRRRQQERLRKRLDRLSNDYEPIVAALVAGNMDYLRGLSALNQLRGRNREALLERLLLRPDATPVQVPVLRRLSEDLGMVRRWQQDLTGSRQWELLRDSIGRPGGLVGHISELGFLVRAKSAENLRLIRHEPSWPLLVQALDDPHVDVRRVAARALGTLAVPESFPALVNRLESVVLEPEASLSLRAIKAAMVDFPLEQAIHLAALLNHNHPRVRFLATDAIREIVDRRAALDKDFVLSEQIFPRRLAETFLCRLPFDRNPDVRARAAPVIAYLPENPRLGITPLGREPRPNEVLSRLIDDPQWVVRLHAVRALGKPRCVSLAPKMATRLTDPDWRVREATARALLALGREGTEQLFEFLVEVHDRCGQEQIIEELERDGLIMRLLRQYVQGTGVREGRILEAFVNQGKTSCLEGLLQNGAGPEVRRRFWMDFKGHPARRIRAWAKRITGN